MMLSTSSAIKDAWSPEYSLAGQRWLFTIFVESQLSEVRGAETNYGQYLLSRSGEKFSCKSVVSD